MKQLVILSVLMLLSSNLSHGQSEEQHKILVDKEAINEQKEVIRKVEKQEKKVAKAEKEGKKKAKAEKKAKKLIDNIKAKEKAITKNENKVVSIQHKLKKGTERGTLSPVDIDKMNAKIDKLSATIAKDKEQLEKLQKKK